MVRKWAQMVAQIDANICVDLCFLICVHLWIVFVLCPSPNDFPVTAFGRADTAN